MRLHLILLVIIGAVLFNTCTTSLTGNSSETSNGVTVVASAGSVTGNAPPHSLIYLIPGNFKPLDPKRYDSLFTDTSGAFSFRVSDGSYTMFCYGNDGMRAMVRLSVNDTIVSGDTLFTTLSAPGSIEGYISIANEDLDMSYFYIEGSIFFTRVDPNGYFRLDSIPEGNYIIKQLSVSEVKIVPDTLSYEVTSMIKVSSDSVTVLKWR